MKLTLIAGKKTSNDVRKSGGKWVKSILSGMFLISTAALYGCTGGDSSSGSCLKIWDAETKSFITDCPDA